MNNDNNRFCSGCGSELTSETTENIPDHYIPLQSEPHPINFLQSKKPNKPLTIFDIMTIFSFVSSIIGCFCLSLIFEPAAIITAFVGFKKGNRYKALSASAIIISIIGFVIQLFTALYKNGIISKWFMSGIFY